jgi:hypothetical protein
MLPGAREYLLACGFGDVEDLSDFPMRVVEGLPQHVHSPLVRGQALKKRENRVRHRFTLFG